MNIKEIIEFWKGESGFSKNGNTMLWKSQAGMIAEVIEQNEISKAIEILEKDAEKYKNMSVVSYNRIAIRQLKQLN